ncbi:uncharacterized protein [Palaemon carinicauda]|uniref:uncharacterized protein n=1 Tax=Palaemon carinicauda TaxID=392227 RepID=UPI0035B5CEE6
MPVKNQKDSNEKTDSFKTTNSVSKTLDKARHNSNVDWIRKILKFLLIVQQINTATSDKEHLLKAEYQELANQWAPIVWLHSKEQFYPHSVASFLQHVKPSKYGKGEFLVIDNGETEITLPPLPKGRRSWDTHMMASYNAECKSCPLPQFMYGKKPGKEHIPPTYATINICAPRKTGKKLSSDGNINYQESLSDAGIEDNIDITQNTSESSISHYTLVPGVLDVQEDETKDYPPLAYNQNYTAMNNISVIIEENSQTKLEHFSNATGSQGQGHNISTIDNTDIFESIPEVNYQEINNTFPEREITALKTSPLSSESGRGNGTALNTNVQSESEDPRDLEGVSSSSKKLNNTFGFHRKAKQQNKFSEQSQQFSVTYWLFYPYNKGKKICTTTLFFLGRILQPTLGGECYGEEIYMGNHVGDWEHITIKFEGRLPKQLYIASHNFGAFYTYDHHNHVFRYQSEDTREGLTMFPEYPKLLRLHENHPIIFAALGSHGLWPTPGTHHYNSIPVLKDETDYGTPWLTWQNLEIIDLDNFSELSPFQKFWLSYEGRWGNPSQNCHTLMGGFCEINQGPTGVPRKRLNFPCPR